MDKRVIRVLEQAEIAELRKWLEGHDMRVEIRDDGTMYCPGCEVNFGPDRQEKCRRHYV